VKISVVTVCRNDINGLKNTFESIQSQDYNDIEWCVIDGNSADGTATWLKDNHRLKGSWLSEPDTGIYDAMNKGVRLSTGKYILFMNSGDRLAQSDVISNLVDLIKREKATPDFVYGDSLDVEESGRSYYRKALPVSYIKAGMITRHQAMLYRRESICDEKYASNFKLSGDYALTASLLMKNNIRVVKVNLPICLFSSGGKHETHRVRALLEDFEIRRKILKENLTTSVLLFCVHLLHHSIKKLIPSLNRKLIYNTWGRD
jgi:putative colanic acid biosynthesis glycosyltransferase